MKHFCEQIIEFHENKNGLTTKTNKHKKSVISVEKRGKEKESEKVSLLEPQQQTNNGQSVWPIDPEWRPKTPKRVKNLENLKKPDNVAKQRN